MAEHEWGLIFYFLLFLKFAADFQYLTSLVFFFFLLQAPAQREDFFFCFHFENFFAIIPNLRCEKTVYVIIISMYIELLLKKKKIFSFLYI